MVGEVEIYALHQNEALERCQFLLLVILLLVSLLSPCRVSQL
jgi:hypothetical protein